MRIQTGACSGGIFLTSNNLTVRKMVKIVPMTPSEKRMINPPARNLDLASRPTPPLKAASPRLGDLHFFLTSNRNRMVTGRGRMMMMMSVIVLKIPLAR